MKRFLPLLILSGLLFGQDVLITLSGKVWIGEYLGEKDEKSLLFKTSGNKPTPVLKSTIKEVKSENGELKWSYLWIDREKNKGIKVLVMPFKDDLYGITELVEENNDSLGYTIIDNSLGLKYLHKENVSMDDINDFNLQEAGKSVGANIVIYGYAYTYQVPFKYSATTSDAISVGELWQNRNNDLWIDMFNAIGKTLVVGEQYDERNMAISQAGTYVNLTYFALNLETGKKMFIVRNKTVLKVG